MTPQNQVSIRKFILENVFWFVASLALAFLIWMTAVSESDPIEQWRVSEAIPIRIQVDEGLIVTNSAEIRSTATIQLRAQRSQRSLIVADDIIVIADLTGYTPGTHTVPLEVTISSERRATLVNILPSQITVNLQVESSRLVPVVANITAPPALIYTASQPNLVERQVTVSGPESLVDQVVRGEIAVDLSDAQATFSNTARVALLDADGNVVTGVTADPTNINYSVTIQPNTEVREITIQPITIGTLPDGYILSSIEYNPTQVYVNGPADALAMLSDILPTSPVDLSVQTSSFEQLVDIELPDDRLVIIGGQSQINLRVTIEAQTITRQFESVPIEIVGSRSDLTYSPVPQAVSVLISGPQAVLDTLTQQDIRVVVDVSGQAPSDTVYRMTPTVAQIARLNEVNITVLPPQIDVMIQNNEIATEAPASE